MEENVEQEELLRRTASKPCLHQWGWENVTYVTYLWLRRGWETFHREEGQDEMPMKIFLISEGLLGMDFANSG
jgi:hypothetical protein